MENMKIIRTRIKNTDALSGAAPATDQMEELKGSKESEPIKNSLQELSKILTAFNKSQKLASKTEAANVSPIRKSEDIDDLAGDEIEVTGKLKESTSKALTKLSASFITADSVKVQPDSYKQTRKKVSSALKDLAVLFTGSVE